MVEQGCTAGLVSGAEPGRREVFGCSVALRQPIVLLQTRQGQFLPFDNGGQGRKETGFLVAILPR